MSVEAKPISQPTKPEQTKSPNSSTEASKPVQPSNDRPIWLPEKFKSEEAMAKAYLELEKEYSRMKGAPLPDEPKAKVEAPIATKPAKDTSKLPSDILEKAPEAVTAAPDKAAVVQEAVTADPQAQLAAKGLDMSKYEAEFMSTNGISKESRAELNAAGFSDAMIDTHIAGSQAQEAQMLQEVGVSKDQIKDIVSWAADGLTKGEMAAYSKLIESRDIEQIKMGLAFAKSKYEAATGKSPKLVQGHSAPLEQGYQSGEQLRTDMRDPRYIKDPAYRDMVDAKMKRSDHKKLTR